MSDWENLFQAIRSVAGVIEYVHRAIAERSVLDVPLGHEKHRFLALSEADANTWEPAPSVPWLSTAALEDPQAADFFGHVTNRMWLNDAALPVMRTGDYLPALEFLDQVPPTSRVVVGRRWLTYLRGALDDGPRSGFAMTPQGTLVSLFEAVGTDDNEERFASQLMELTIHRAHLVAEHVGRMPALGVGALKRPSAVNLGWRVG